jgi:3,4-dihydroxy 2-butanone 4-phosphate synthase/GTP cyclohydrolase II
MLEARELLHLPLPTPFGQFEAHVFEAPSGVVHLALTQGDIRGRAGVLTRLHSECLTGDALGSLRCDCGVQLRLALRMIATRGEGVLVYTTGHEGRGIGLVNKLRAYLEQDRGADTVDANLDLGLPVDSRSYDEVAEALRALQIVSIRLLTNNPAKVTALRELGITVDEMIPLSTSAHSRNLRYLRTKQTRLGHRDTVGEPPPLMAGQPADVQALMGTVRPPADRPYVVLKYAQTLDGRIATVTGDAKWISGDAERSVSHGLRAACDAVMVGVGTVLQDDPELTVRMVPGANPIRVVLDSNLRTPSDSKIVGAEAATLILTTQRALALRGHAFAEKQVAVRAVRSGADGVDIRAALGLLREVGVESLLVEGGAQVITSLLRAGLVDRLVVSIAPKVMGAGTEAVGDLNVGLVANSISLSNRMVCAVAEDVLIAFDLEPAPARDAADELLRRRELEEEALGATEVGPDHAAAVLGRAGELDAV